MKSVAHILSEPDKERIMVAIREAEQLTSGEIKVYFEKYCDEEVTFRARKVFHELGMGKTTLHTGVLIYVAYKEKVFAIIGDQGIHENVQGVFWSNLRNMMKEYFSKNLFADGLIKAIELSGERLAHHFPAQKGDKNELADDIIIADE